MKRILTVLVMAVLCTANIFAQDTLYVKPDASSNAWSGHTGVYTDLQTAIDAAVDGDQIWVAEGSYRPSVRIPNGNEDRCKSFILKSGISLYGGFAGTETSIDQRDNEDDDWDFANATILTGDITNTPSVATDNSYHVVYGKNVSNVVIDGFTISDGYGNREGYLDDQKGGGIFFNTSCSNCQIIKCVIGDNTALTHGGGAYLPYTCTLSTCLVVRNATLATGSTGGGVYFDNCSFPNVVAEYCLFSNNSCPATSSVSSNTRYGGGAVSSGSNCQFSHCNFTLNSCTNPGGAVYCSGGNKFEFCEFTLNTASKGGAIFGNTSSSMLTSNCLFINNAATIDGGCISISGSSCCSVNCTFVGNSAPTNTVINGSGYTVYNCVLWNNGTNTENFMPSNILKKYTAAEGVQFPGAGNINVAANDFHFSNPCSIQGTTEDMDELYTIMTADYHMNGQSVCKDGGNMNTIDLSGYQFPAEDLDGEARVNGGLIDLGCYEIQCEEEALSVHFTILDTLYNDEMPGTGSIQVLVTVENFNSEYDYDITYNLLDVINEIEESEYEFNLDFPCNQTVTVRMIDSEGCTQTDDTTFVIDSLFNPHVGIASSELQNLTITPNPVATQLTIHNLPNNLQNAQVEIYDVNGKLTFTQNVVENNPKINVTNYQSGIYFIRLINDGKVIGTSIIIKQ